MLLVLVLLLIVGAVAGGWWAARVTLPTNTAGSADSAQEDVGVVWAEASQGSVGQSLGLSTTLRQPTEVVAANTLMGVVTSTDAGEVSAGDVVYVVGDTPVRVVQGSVPFWRDLAESDKGEDVRPLQQLLIDKGYLGGVADGDFGAGTEAAVKAWQKDEGKERTGIVPLGELVSVRELPTVVQLGESIAVGKTLAGGEDAVLAPTGSREFVLVVSQEQSRLIPAEAVVEVSFEEFVWPAQIVGSTQDEFGGTEFELVAVDGGPVCGDDCSALPNVAEVTLRSEVIVVPQTEGVSVPAAAVHIRADGGTYVNTQGGEVDVTVIGSGQGIAIVEGIEIGALVQVLGDVGVGPVPADDGSTTDSGR